MFMVKRIRKAIAHVLAPRKGIKRSVAKPVVEVKAQVEDAEERLKGLIDAFRNAINEYDGYDDEVLIDAAAKLGLKEVSENFDTDALKAYCAAVEAGIFSGKFWTEVNRQMEVLNDIQNIIAEGNYTLLEEVDSFAELGESLVDKWLTNDAPEMIMDYIDLETLGETWSEGHDGHFSNWGYFQYGAI